MEEMDIRWSFWFITLWIRWNVTILLGLNIFCYSWFGKPLKNEMVNIFLLNRTSYCLFFLWFLLSLQEKKNAFFCYSSILVIFNHVFFPRVISIRFTSASFAFSSQGTSETSSSYNGKLWFDPIPQEEGLLNFSSGWETEDISCNYGR